MLPLRSEHLFTLTATVTQIIDIGATPAGAQRLIPIDGGTFEGPKLRGRLLPGGADCMLVRGNRTSLPDVRLALETDDGARILMTYSGLRHGPPAVMDALARGEAVEPSAYYFRVAIFFSTAAEKYGWLNRALAVGTGHRLPTGPVYDVYEIL